MKKYLLTLTMLLCSLLLFSAALADEAPLACDKCGNTDLEWFTLVSDGRDAHAKFCEPCYMIVGKAEPCEPIPGSATCITPERCKVCGYSMTTNLSPDPDAHSWGAAQYSWNYVGDENGMPAFVCTAYRHCRNYCGASNYETVDAACAITEPATCTTYAVATYTASFEASWAETQVNEQLVGEYADHTRVTIEAVAPTCTEAGSTECVYCAVCGRIIKAQEKVPALGHTEAVDAAIEPTCTEAGFTAGKHCSACGEILVAQHKIPALGHAEVIDEAVEPSCTETGLTEGMHCSVCDEIIAAQEVIPANGHSYKSIKVAPDCMQGGYTKHICTVCGDTYTDDIVGALGHWYELWTPNMDGTHSAACRRAGCEYVGTAECTLYEITVIDGETETILTVCPVCGDHEETPFEAIIEAAIAEIDRYAIPQGEMIVRGMDAAFEGVMYAFTAAYEYAGEVEPFNGVVSVTVPLDAEKYTGFRLVRVDVTPATETEPRAEVWTDIAFTFEEGKLTFETDAAGLFLLIPQQ